MNPNPTMKLKNAAYRLYALLQELPQMASLKGARLCLQLGATGQRALARLLEGAFVRCPKLMALRADELPERLFLLGLDLAEADGDAADAPQAEAEADTTAGHDDDREKEIQKVENRFSPFCDDDDDNAGARTHTCEEGSALGSERATPGGPEAASPDGPEAATQGGTDKASAGGSERATPGGPEAASPDEPLPVDYRRWTAAQLRQQAERCRGEMGDEELERFVQYWTAADPKGRMRFQRQRTFSCVERLRTWVRKSRAYAQEHELALKSRYGAPMVPPTVEEVAEECRRRGVDEENGRAFHHYYAAVGWRQGQHYIEDWRSALLRWEAVGRRREEAKRRRQALAVNGPLAEGAAEEANEGGDGKQSCTNETKQQSYGKTIRHSEFGWGLQQQVDSLYRDKIDELRQLGSEEGNGRGLLDALDLDPEYVLSEVVDGGVAKAV